MAFILHNQPFFRAVPLGYFMRRSLSFLNSIYILALLGLPTFVAAETSRSLDEIATDLVNPASGIAHIANDVVYRTSQGDLPDAGDQTGVNYLFRPSLGLSLANGKKVLFRATVPLVYKQAKYVADREYYDYLIRQRADTMPTDGFFETGHSFLGDISYDFAYGGVSDNNWITMYGIAGLLATSKDTSAARGQYLLGPEFALGKVTDWGVIGAWATHLVDVSGDNPANIDTRLTSLKVFFAYGLGNGWQLISNPVITYDWEGASGNKLLLPIGGGIAKTTRIGRIPVQLALDIQNYVVSPDAFGPKWLMTFRFTPVFANLFQK